MDTFGDALGDLAVGWPQAASPVSSASATAIRSLMPALES